MKIILKVFLSTSISSINSDEKYKEICEYVEKTIRTEYEALRPDDGVIIFSNYGENEIPSGVNLKLHQLELAFNKMKQCDVFFLLREIDGTIKSGCLVELNAWLSSTDSVPIIIDKPSFLEED